MKKIIITLIIILTVLIAGLLVFTDFRDKESPDTLIENDTENNCEPFPFSLCERHKNFLNYYKKHFYDMWLITLRYKNGMDKISAQYIDNFIKCSDYYNRCINKCKYFTNLSTDFDKEISELTKTEPVPAIYEKYKFNRFLYISMYGMRDLPQDVLAEINGKDIIDLGAYPGDATYALHKYFPKSNIYAYEPVKGAKEYIDKMIMDLKKEDDNYKLIHTIQKGAGDSNYTKEQMDWFGYSSLDVPIVSLDDDYPKIGNNNLGLIKMDVEGMESDVIKGAQNIIKKYKPILIISIYHNPQDFFEMKQKIIRLNPDYKFMLRRATDDGADIDVVLIAYL